ncbi:MAG: hypothetical protein P8J50_04795 [Acidimicrobiales bacterium]|nr:hypothetical protein [Acidimicrobiales bacterium]
MGLEHQKNAPSKGGASLPTRLVIGGLAVFGAVSLVQWVLTSLIAFVKFGLLVVVVLGVVGGVLSAKAGR